MASIKEAVELWRKKHLDEDHSASSRGEMITYLLFDLIEFVKKNGFTEAALEAELENPRTWVENEYTRTTTQ
jgi:hypothetical protein